MRLRSVLLASTLLTAVFATAACGSDQPADTPGTGGTASGTGGTASGSGGTAASGSGGTTASGSGGTATGAGGTASGAGGTTAAGAGGTASGAGGTTAGAGGTGVGGTAGSGGTGVSGGYPENTGADCQVMAGQRAESEKLPDPFAMNDGTRISSKTQWACRRNEIKKDLEEYEIGPKPEPPTVAATLSGNSLSVKVTTDAGEITLSSNVGGSGECVMISMGLGASISGCRTVTFSHDQVVGYDGGSGSHDTSDPYYTVYPELKGKIGKYSAWAWGVSRLIDGLDQVKDELGIDIAKVGVTGCSYAGKMALFSGAFDERVALTIAQESGGGGINSWRTSQDYNTRTGTNIEKIDNTNSSWFFNEMGDPYTLPHDHHELIAMIAPRAVLALGNPTQVWLGDESGFKSIRVAEEVWKSMGLEDRIGWDFTPNHPHCQASSSQTTAINAFVDKFLKGMDANTDIHVQPTSGTSFNLDYTVPWTTPTLQ